MRIYYSLLLGMGLVLAGGETTTAVTPVTRLDIRVVDDQGLPVQDATIEVGCTGGRVGVKGPTDTNGFYRYEERIVGELGCEVAKKGYYLTQGLLWKGPSSGGQVPPVNSYTVMLKRIFNPVPMPLHIVTAKMPAGKELAGFDLEAGDWVGPYGKGIRTDMLVTMRYADSPTNGYEKIQAFSFANPNDGVIAMPFRPGGPHGLRSLLPVAQMAPFEGYANSLEQVQRRRPGGDPEDNTNPKREYMFRVRTVTNGVGEVIQANVGWIFGGFNLSGPSKNLRFMYYYNPDSHSRSLEPEEIAKRQTGQ